MQAAIYYKRSRGQNYMMRSEKRPGYSNMPPKKPKKSVWYQILTVIFLILLCPVGLIMLWRKRLRWPNPVKLLATLLSLVMLFLELGAALWYPFENDRVAHVQHTVATAIDQAMDTAGGFFEEIGTNWDAVVQNGQEIGAAAGNHVLGLVLEAIASPTPVPTQAPPMTLTEGEGRREDIASLMNRPTPTPEPTEAPTVEPTETPTIAPTEPASTSANILERPTPPGETPHSSLNPNATPTPVPPVTSTPSPTATPLVTAAPTAEPTLVPTIDPALIPKIQSPGEALTVWHTSDGRFYHKASVCGSMSNAREHTLASAIANNKSACPYCSPVEAKWAREKEPVVYVSTDRYWHIKTSCESNTASCSPMLLEEARKDSSLRPCDACGSRYYVDGVPTAATAAPAITAAPTTSAGLVQLITGREITVWHTSDGTYYHKASKCGTMSNAREYTLAEAVANNKKTCPYCHPAEASLAREDGYVVFAGTDSVWHAAASCAKNTSDYTILTLTDARADHSLTPCDRCGARAYASGSLPAQNTGSNPAATAEPINDGLNLSDVVNGDTLVYYSGNTSHYHRRNRCASSTTTTFMPHTLMDALLEGKIACPVCSPDEPQTK